MVLSGVKVTLPAAVAASCDGSTNLDHTRQRCDEFGTSPSRCEARREAEGRRPCLHLNGSCFRADVAMC